MIHPVPANRAEWLALRAGNIGGSEVSALFGVQPDYALSLFALHHVKAGKIEAPDISDDPRVQAGLILEPAIAKLVAMQEGWTLSEAVYATDDKCPGLGATLDYVITEPTAKDLEWDRTLTGPGALELKNVDYIVHKRKWTNGEPPIFVLLQLQSELAATGYTWGAVGCLIGGNERRVYRYKADPRIQSAIRKKVTQFWRDVRAGKEPAVDGTEATATALRSLYPELADDALDMRESNEWAEACADALRLAEERKKIERDEDEAKNRVEALLQGHKRAWGNGFSVSVSVTPAKPSREALPGEIIKGRKESRRMSISEQVNA